MTDKELEKIAIEAVNDNNHALAAVLYTYLGASKVGMTGKFARNCQDWALKEYKEIEEFNNKRNN